MTSSSYCWWCNLVWTYFSQNSAPRTQRSSSSPLSSNVKRLLVLSASCAPHVFAPRQPKPPSQFHNFAHFQCFRHISFKNRLFPNLPAFVCVMEQLWFTCGPSRQYYMPPFPPYFCRLCLYKVLFWISREHKYFYFFWWKYISGYLSCIVPKCFLLPHLLLWQIFTLLKFSATV